MNRTILALVCGLAGLVPLAPPATAQNTEMTQKEIEDRFRAQKTRGLSIAPVVTEQPQTTTAATPTTVAPANMAIMPKDQQVNINISFDFDSAALRADQKPKLTALCGAMKAVDTEAFRILGHTDASGSEAYNQRLSKLRAEEVKRFLVTDCGIAPERLEATGVGEAFPFDPDDPRADVNRRVEFQVLG
ncbi:OmpA family protein [Oceaniglobus trochenteri]|uniref:OmpA family protein n=1 Tax=Oceaniglobus trochenteri TaxID=2763260 RepID=UPI001D000076|nr:OmpA family protein [Oceaniglobus trochenteri]